MKRQVDDDDDDESTEELVEELSAGQALALQRVAEGRNVFITGEAGTGKSYMIKAIKRKLDQMRRVYHVAATTGSAAYNIEGTTVHSFVGVGLGVADLDNLLKLLEKPYKKAKVEHWRRVHTLIIDEVSMLDALFFEKINAIGKHLRRNSDKAFGGLQLVLIGDFLQLPPVIKAEEKRLYRYVFQTPTWRELKLCTIKLDVNYRQKEDGTFLRLLAQVRLGTLAPEEEHLLRARVSTVAPEGVTKVFSYRADVQRVNKAALALIEGEEHCYDAVIETSYKATPFDADKEEKEGSYPADKHLPLKEGARVLLCYNLATEDGLYNGCEGTVVTFEQAYQGGKLYPVVEFYNGIRTRIEPNTWTQYEGKKVVSSFTQVPLLLCYAISVHKAQGLTLPSALVDMNFFEHGQCYVAISRVRRLEDLHIKNYSLKGLLADQTVIDFYRNNQLL